MNYRLLTLLMMLGLAGCATAPTPLEDSFRDPVLSQLDASARAAVGDGNYARAARFYELALARARTMDVGIEIARASYNRGACLLMLNQAAEAQRVLQQASAEFLRLKRDAASVWLLEARAARMLGDPALAGQLADRVLADGRGDAVRLQAWLIKGSLAVEAGDQDAAVQSLKRARSLLHDDPALRAGVAALSGQIAMAGKKPADAGLEFDREAAFLQRAARWSDMAAALGKAGEAYQQAGQMDDATQRFLRAARSWFGQGQLVPALRAVEQATAVAEKAGNEAQARDIGRLLEEIRQAVQMARAAEPAE